VGRLLFIFGMMSKDAQFSAKRFTHQSFPRMQRCHPASTGKFEYSFFFPHCLVSLPSVWTKVATQVEGLSWGQEHLWSSMLLNCGGYWSLLPEWDRSRDEPANKERTDNGLDGCRKHSWYTDDLQSTTNVKILYYIEENPVGWSKKPQEIQRAGT
jgi:hypothetical protein